MERMKVALVRITRGQWVIRRTHNNRHEYWVGNDGDYWINSIEGAQKYSLSLAKSRCRDRGWIVTKETQLKRQRVMLVRISRGRWVIRKSVRNFFYFWQSFGGRWAKSIKRVDTNTLEFVRGVCKMKGWEVTGQIRRK